MRISKSRFVAGVQCLKRLYWLVHGRIERVLSASLRDSGGVSLLMSVFVQ